MNHTDFDLLVHDWIPCIGIDKKGGPKLCSIRSVLENARKIRAIEHESPPVRIAVLRLLLAFCYRVAHANDLPLCSFRNWKTLRDRWGDGVPPEWIDRYLDACSCRDRFRLFDEEHPFFQVAGLRCKGGKQPEPARRLAFEQFAGTPSTLWEHMPNEPTTPESAVYLVTCQAFGASASNTSNAVIGAVEYSPTGRTFAPTYTGYTVWLEGNSLLETLLLNLVDYDLTDTDLPIWEKPLTGEVLRVRQPRKAKEGDVDKNGKQIKIGTKMGDYRAGCPTGPAQLFTWPSRAVLMTKPENGRVRSVHFTQGLKLVDRPVDPMKPYDRDGRAIRLDPDKAAWRDLYALLALQPDQNRTVLALSHAARGGFASARINLAGIARGDEAAKILFWRHERLPVSTALLADVNLIERLGGLLRSAEQAESELNRRTRRIARLLLAPECESPNGRKPDDKDVNRLAGRIDPRPAYWARLEKHLSELLANLPDDWDTRSSDWKPDGQQWATAAWRDHVMMEAERALEESVRSVGTTARAIQAVAQVRLGFNYGDIVPQPFEVVKVNTRQKGKGGNMK